MLYHNGWIYYYNMLDDAKFYRITVDGSDKTIFQ
jgi:hypothetical protein